MKETFKYPFFFRLIYRYGNILATFVLLLYMLPLLDFSKASTSQKLYAGIIVIMIFLLNRYFLKLNQKTPYVIEVDNEKVTGRDYFLSSKSTEFNISRITELRGGIFEGKPRGMMKIFSGDSEFIFYHSLAQADKFEAYIISKVNRDIYEKVVAALKEKQARKN